MGTSSKKIAAIAALSTIWPTGVLPQQGGTASPGGLQMDFGINSKVTVDDNFELNPSSSGTTTIFDNRLSFGLTSITASQELRLSGSGVLRYAEIPGRTVSGFEDPRFQFNYKIENSNSRLTADARYRRADREFLDPFQVEQEEQILDGTGLFTGGGTLTTRNASVTYETGLNAPLGFRITGSHAEKQYEDLSILNSRLFDTETDSIDATVSAKLSPVTVMRFNAGHKKYRADDSVQTERETVDYSIGITQDLDQVWVLDARLGRTEVDTTDTTGSRTTKGTNGLLKLTRTLANGSIFASYDSTVNQNGTREALRFGRDLQLPSGNLSASLGVTRTPAGNTGSNAAITYSHALASSNFNLSLKRDVSTNNNSEEIVDTRLAVGYDYQIDAISSLNFSVNYGRSASADDLSTVPTVERTTLTASYSRALTQDWDLTGGVTLRRRSDTSAPGDAESNSVFVTLDRTFSFRP